MEDGWKRPHCVLVQSTHASVQAHAATSSGAPFSIINPQTFDPAGSGRRRAVESGLHGPGAAWVLQFLGGGLEAGGVCGLAVYHFLSGGVRACALDFKTAVLRRATAALRW